MKSKQTFYKLDKMSEKRKRKNFQTPETFHYCRQNNHYIRPGVTGIFDHYNNFFLFS